VFVWQVTQNRILSNDNLCRRGILGREKLHCIGGCGEIETSIHLFFACPIVSKVWFRIAQWLCVQVVFHSMCTIHFITFTGLVCVTKYAVQGMEAIWFASMWSIWKVRNARIFHHKNWDNESIVDGQCQAFIVELADI